MRQMFDQEEYFKAIALDMNAPQFAMANNGSYLAFYGTQQGLWEGQAAHIKMQLGIEEAVVDGKVREEGGKPTADAIKARVASDEEVIKLKKSLTVANMQDTLYTNACRAFNDRGQNARSLNTRQRNERENSTSHLVDTDVETVAYTREDKQESLRKVSRG